MGRENDGARLVGYGLFRLHGICLDYISIRSSGLNSSMPKRVLL
jgi:hypothetical protein